MFDPLWLMCLYYVPCSSCRWLFTANSLFLLLLCHHCCYCCQCCLLHHHHHHHHHLLHLQPYLHHFVHSTLYLHFIQLPHYSNCILGIRAHTTTSTVSASSKVCSCHCPVLHNSFRTMPLQNLKKKKSWWNVGPPIAALTYLQEETPIGHSQGAYILWVYRAGT